MLEQSENVSLGIQCERATVPTPESCLFSGCLPRALAMCRTPWWEVEGWERENLCLPSRGSQGNGEEPKKSAHEWIQTVAGALIFTNGGDRERKRVKESLHLHSSLRPDGEGAANAGASKRACQAERTVCSASLRQEGLSLSGNWWKASVSPREWQQLRWTWSGRFMLGLVGYNKVFGLSWEKLDTRERHLAEERDDLLCLEKISSDCWAVSQDGEQKGAGGWVEAATSRHLSSGGRAWVGVSREGAGCVCRKQWWELLGTDSAGVREGGLKNES